MRQVWTVVRRWVNLALIDAVRTGSPLPQQWSVGLRAIGGLGLVAFLLAALLATLSPVLRATTELVVAANGRIVPSWSMPLLLWVVVIALSMAATAVIHLHPVLRFVGWFALTTSMAPFAVVLAHRPLLAFGLLGFASATLLLLIVVRWRARFHPLEFVITTIAVGVATLTPMAVVGGGNSFGYDQRPMNIESVLTTFILFAMPLMFVTGFAMAQVTVRAATDLGPALGRRGLRIVAPVLGVLVVALFAWNWQRGVENWTWLALLPSAMLLATFVLFSVPVWVRARRVGLPPVAEVDEGFYAWLYPIALAIIAQNIPVYVTSSLTPIVSVLGDPASGMRVLESAAFTQTPMARMVWRALVTIGLLVAAWLLARRGRIAGPLAACGSAAVIGFGVLGSATGLPLSSFTPEAITEIAVVVGMVGLVIRLVRRRVDHRVLIGVVSLLAVAAAYPLRHVIGEPVDQIVGQAGGALVVFGVTWQLLTGAEFTRNSSRVAPMPSRVMLFIANIVLTTGLFAWVALTRQSTSSIDPGAFADAGDWMFGTPLLMAVLVLLVAQIFTGGDARAIETREDEALQDEVEARRWSGEGAHVLPPRISSGLPYAQDSEWPAPIATQPRPPGSEPRLRE